jgi:DNA-binding transcriptional ArsR family regulator
MSAAQQGILELELPPERFVGSWDGERTRERIREALRLVPGIHKSALGRVTGVAAGTLTHHLRILQRRGDLRVLRLRNRVHLFLGPSMQVSPLALGPVAATILDLLRGEALRVCDLKAKTAFSRKRISGQLRVLLDAGAVVREPATGRYRLAPRRASE